MKLHTHTTLFTEAIKATAQQMEMNESFVEKDYWVTLALHKLFSNAIAQNLVFKGGTSLAKCYKIIKRFSEDIDLVLLDVEDLNENQKKNLIKQVSQTIHPILPEIEVEGITHKTGKIRKTVHQFPILFANTDVQIRNEIILEVNWLGDPDPYHTIEISSYIYDMMAQTRQDDLITSYQMQPFAIKAMDIKRTFCEKIMSLIRFSYKENPIDELRKKIRHTYDLHQLLKIKEVARFLQSQEFETMMIKVAKNDLDAYKDSRSCLKNHPSAALLFSDLDQIWLDLKNTYTTNFRDLVYTELPKEADVFETLSTIKQRINSMSWIKPENQ